MNPDNLPSDPGRLFTQQPPSSIVLSSHSQRNTGSARMRSSAGRRIQITGHFEIKSYSRTVLTFWGEVWGNPAEELDLSAKVSSVYLSWLSSLKTRKTVMDWTGKNNGIVYKERTFHTYVVVYLCLFHQCPQRRDCRRVFQLSTPYEWRKEKKKTVFVQNLLYHKD